MLLELWMVCFRWNVSVEINVWIGWKDGWLWINESHFCCVYIFSKCIYCKYDMHSICDLSFELNNTRVFCMNLIIWIRFYDAFIEKHLYRFEMCIFLLWRYYFKNFLNVFLVNVLYRITESNNLINNIPNYSF